MKLIASLIGSVLLLGCSAVAKVHPVRVQVQGTSFVTPDGRPFEWRGITAFRLAELVAAGKEREAASYLDWAGKNGVTVVRVLAMAHNLFHLSPADGLRALPRVLELAAERGMHVEIVALADTAHLEVDLDAQVKAIGQLAAAHPNALVELANEPFHPTQNPSLHENATLERLATLIPAEVVVAFGADAPDDAPVGDYVTVHTHRGEEPWDHVISLAGGRAIVDRVNRPVVSDEPIGAASRVEPGRRDNSPARFRAAAMLTRMAGMHATFHYEGGLHARIPTGTELACFQAWMDGWRQLPAGIETGSFRQLPDTTGHTFETTANGGRYVLTIRNGKAELVRRALPRLPLRE